MSDGRPGSRTTPRSPDRPLRGALVLAVLLILELVLWAGALTTSRDNACTARGGHVSGVLAQRCSVP